MKLFLFATLIVFCSASTLYRGKNVSVRDDGSVEITTPSGKRIVIDKTDGHKNIEIEVSGPHMITKKIHIGEGTEVHTEVENPMFTLDEELRPKRDHRSGHGRGITTEQQHLEQQQSEQQQNVEIIDRLQEQQQKVCKIIDQLQQQQNQRCQNIAALLKQQQQVLTPWQQQQQQQIGQTPWQQQENLQQQINQELQKQQQTTAICRLLQQQQRRVGIIVNLLLEQQQQQLQPTGGWTRQQQKLQQKLQEQQQCQQELDQQQIQQHLRQQQQETMCDAVVRQTEAGVIGGVQPLGRPTIGRSSVIDYLLGRQQPLGVWGQPTRGIWGQPKGVWEPVPQQQIVL